MGLFEQNLGGAKRGRAGKISERSGLNGRPCLLLAPALQAGKPGSGVLQGFDHHVHRAGSAVALDFYRRGLSAQPDDHDFVAHPAADPAQTQPARRCCRQLIPPGRAKHGIGDANRVSTPELDNPDRAAAIGRENRYEGLRSHVRATFVRSFEIAFCFETKHVR